MRRWVLQSVVLAVLGLFVFDGIQDARDGCETPTAEAGACHACSCGPRLVSQGVIELPVSPAPVLCAISQPSSYAFLPSVSFFHPPCLAA